MRTREKIKIGIVEDNKYYNKVLEKTVQNLFDSTLKLDYELELTTWETPHSCIEQLPEDLDILILDHLFENHEKKEDDLNGEDVMLEAERSCPDCKVIMVSRQTSPQLAVDLMKKGIYEYVDKNQSSSNRITQIVQQILNERKRA